MGNALPNLYSRANSFNKKSGGAIDAVALLTHKPAADPLSLFTPKEIAPPEAPPPIAPPTTMPDQQAIEADKKRSLADQISRRGRASTILTDQNDKLGG